MHEAMQNVEMRWFSVVMGHPRSSAT